MLYTQTITIPVNTQKDDYQENIIKLTKGKIIRIVVFFPWGCAGLCHIQIVRRTWQVFPLSRGEWLNGNNMSFDFATDIDLTSEPFQLIIRSYNLDDAYEHSPTVSVEMIKGTVPEAFMQFMQEIGN